jgi:coproporphyrinogen III oxidase-like Fe-S oxidoreductase
MISAAHSKIEQTIDESQDFVQRSIVPILEAEPRLRVDPVDYAHAVKFLGAHRATPQAMIPVIRETLSGAKEATLYAHMPVCRYRCSFCHYPVVVGHGSHEPKAYVESLILESEIFRKAVPEVRDKVISSLYVGGGTPTLMDDEDINRLIEYFRSNYQLTKNSEITIEGTPETLTPVKIDALMRAGINRVNVGVQVLDDALLSNYGRQHTTEHSLSAISHLIANKDLKVNVDLIYGLPGQSATKFAEDVQTVAEHKPTSMTLYRLRLQRGDELANTGMLRLYQENPELFPSLEQTLSMQIVGRRILETYGYIERPSGWFSLLGNTAQVYDDRWYRQVPLIAFGWWTYSYSRRYEYRNQRNLKAYQDSVDAGQLPIEVCSIFDEIEQYRRFIQFRLKASHAIHTKALRRAVTRSSAADEYFSSLSDRLVELGLANKLPKALVLTPAGKVLVEEILSRLV